MVDEDGLPLVLLLTEGQMNDHKGAKLIFPALPQPPFSLATKGMTAMRSERRSRRKT